MQKTKHSRRPSRWGASAVEFALCLPIALGFSFGTIEATNMVFVKRALVAAAYEAGNVATAIGGTSTVAQQRAQAVINSFGVKSVTVTVTPAVTTSTTTGTQVTVTCSAPLNANTVTGWCLQNVNLSTIYIALHL